jgi:hypothetical protein
MEPGRKGAASEPQADCLAGIWANSTEQRQILEAGDVEEGLYSTSSSERASL